MIRVPLKEGISPAIVQLLPVGYKATTRLLCYVSIKKRAVRMAEASGSRGHLLPSILQKAAGAGGGAAHQTWLKKGGAPSGGEGSEKAKSFLHICT